MILHPLIVKVKTSIVFTEKVLKLKEMTEGIKEKKTKTQKPTTSIAINQQRAKRLLFLYFQPSAPLPCVWSFQYN